MIKLFLFLFILSKLLKAPIATLDPSESNPSFYWNEDNEQKAFIQRNRIDDDDRAIDFLDRPQIVTLSDDVTRDISADDHDIDADFVAEDFSDTGLPRNFKDIAKKVLGVFDWKPRRKVRYFRQGSITLVSRQPATLYKNGETVLEIGDEKGGYKFVNNVKIYYGDLLAVESTRGTEDGYGVAVDVRVKSHKGRRAKYVHYKTGSGGRREWRGDGEFETDWKTNSTGYCKISRTVVVGDASVEELEEKDAPPLDENTRYVWVSNVDGKVPETAHLRLAVGIRCVEGHEFKRRTTRVEAAQRRGDEFNTGRTSKGEGQVVDGGKAAYASRTDAEGGYPLECKCRAVGANDKSVCYEMLSPMKSYGRCKRRTCGRRYECVAGGGVRLKNCIRRISRYETVLSRDYGGMFLCNTRKSEKPKVFYTMYH